MKVRLIVYVLVGAVAMGGLWWSLKPPKQSVPAAALHIDVDWNLRAGTLTSGESLIRVPQGSTVSLHVSSDTTDELHLHGYDRELAVMANVPATLTFNATLSGRFEIELHHAHRAVGVIEVLPH